METIWMGRYREYVAELVRHTNIVAKQISTRSDVNGIMMTIQEWQVLEYIVEHRFDDDRMIHISDALRIPQSTFSRIVSYLCANGLVDKYQMTNNRKNIILKPSAFGLEFYNTASKNINMNGFSQFFEAMSALDDESLRIVTEALRKFNDELFQNEVRAESESKLIKLTK